MTLGEIVELTGEDLEEERSGVDSDTAAGVGEVGGGVGGGVSRKRRPSDISVM
jgi:hypothetical protein